MQELFKDIKGYEGIYQISNLGRVKSFKHGQEKILKPRFNKNYVMAGLCKNGKKQEMCVHRLVAEAFLEKPEGKNEVNHKDGNRSNNIVTNLEWCNHLENVRHAFATGLIQRKPLTEEQKEFIGRRTKEAMQRSDVQKKLHAPRKKVT